MLCTIILAIDFSPNLILFLILPLALFVDSEMSSPSKSNKDRLQYAFDIAEKELGIAKLLDPEDVDVENPDEKSVMTYVAQFLHKYADNMSQAVIFMKLKTIIIINLIYQFAIVTDIKLYLYIIAHF